MNIDDITIGEAKEILTLLGGVPAAKAERARNRGNTRTKALKRIKRKQARDEMMARLAARDAAYERAFGKDARGQTRGRIPGGCQRSNNYRFFYFMLRQER